MQTEIERLKTELFAVVAYVEQKLSRRLDYLERIYALRFESAEREITYLRESFDGYITACMRDMGMEPDRPALRVVGDEEEIPIEGDPSK